MRVKELFAQGNSILNKSIVLEARLFITGDMEAIVANDIIEAFTNGERIIVQDNSFIANHLLKTLPVYGGGPCIYDEECTISGMIRRHASDLELVEIKSCIVSRDETVISIPF